MNRKRIREKVASVFFSAILAGELAVLADAVLVFNGTALSVVKFAVLFAVLFLLILAAPGFRLKQKRIVTMVVTAVVGIPLLTGFLCWNSVSKSVTYHAVDEGKSALYADQRVMLLVPHQDDDINVLGGVMEEYVKYGSEVYVVFSTNGDYYGLAETRYREAVNALNYIGIPKDHIIFLGYGDQWSREEPHIYNAASGEIVTSAFGRTQTYGTQTSSAYREGVPYTIDNFLSDIESVILEYLPDVIYCVDYDYNIDHRALSHSFEKVMGRILKARTDYRPLVLKGYAYNTAWEAVDDFYSENLLSTQDAFAEMYEPVPEVYRWEERVRLPVNAESLSRSVISAKQQTALSMYESQGGNMYGVRVINSDKVFWHRRTDSLCMDAAIKTSSGDAMLLNDFMLLECRDLLDGEPYDGAWTPEAADPEKQAVIAFPEKEAVSCVVLYDHPDRECNVLNARIEFDDGYTLETGPLDPGGAASRFVVDRAEVSSFKVTLLETEGDAGITEIEAYSAEAEWYPDYVKIMDEAENFVYDYWIDPDGSQTFLVYEPGAEQQEYTVSCSNLRCSAVWHAGGILVECPEGESCVISLSDEDGEVLDSVYIQNPGKLERVWKMLWLRAEEQVMKLCETKRLHERIFVCRLLTKVSKLLA